MPLASGSFGSNLFIEIDGQAAGFVSSFRPPAREAAAITGPGPDPRTQKTLGKPLIRDARLTLSISESGPVLDWITGALRNSVVEKDVAIILANQDYKVTRRIEMQRCLITEIGFPALDAADKSQFQVAVTLQPEDITSVKGSGQALKPLLARTKNWRISNFRVTLAGLDTKYVTRVELPKVTIKVAVETQGISRFPVRHQEVTITGLRTTHASQGIEAAEDFVTKLFADGIVDELERKDMKIELLDPTLQNVLATFTAAGCVPTRFEPAEIRTVQDIPPAAQIDYAVDSLAFELQDAVTV